MIRFRDKPKNKVTTANAPAKDSAAVNAPNAAATHEAQNAAEPLLNANPVKSESDKK